MAVAQGDLSAHSCETSVRRLASRRRLALKGWTQSHRRQQRPRAGPAQTPLPAPSGFGCALNLSDDERADLIDAAPRRRAGLHQALGLEDPTHTLLAPPGAHRAGEGHRRGAFAASKGATHAAYRAHRSGRGG